MGWASKSGRAKTSSTNPQAFAVCDRCGMWYNHVNLSWQFEWRGAALQNIRLLVCKDCLDVPQQQLRSIVVPSDPKPIENPRVQDFGLANSYVLGVSQNQTWAQTGIPVPNGNGIGTPTGGLTTQQTGEPTGGHNQQPGTDPNCPGNSDPGLPPDNIEVPKTGPLT